MAGHDHVEVLVYCVAGVGFGWVGAARKDVDVLDEGDHVRGVAATGAFDVVGVDGAALEG